MQALPPLASLSTRYNRSVPSVRGRLPSVGMDPAATQGQAEPAPRVLSEITRSTTEYSRLVGPTRPKPRGPDIHSPWRLKLRSTMVHAPTPTQRWAFVCMRATHLDCSSPPLLLLLLLPLTPPAGPTTTTCLPKRAVQSCVSEWAVGSGQCALG